MLRSRSRLHGAVLGSIHGVVPSVYCKCHRQSFIYQLSLQVASRKCHSHHCWSHGACNYESVNFWWPLEEIKTEVTFTYEMGRSKPFWTWNEATTTFVVDRWDHPFSLSFSIKCGVCGWYGLVDKDCHWTLHAHMPSSSLVREGTVGRWEQESERTDLLDRRTEKVDNSVATPSEKQVRCPSVVQHVFASWNRFLFGWRVVCSLRHRSNRNTVWVAFYRKMVPSCLCLLRWFASYWYSILKIWRWCISPPLFSVR